MKKIKETVLRIIRSKIVQYSFVLIIGIVFVGFLDDNSIWAHMRNKQTISNLQEEIAFYEGEYNRDQARIRELETDPKAMEKIARERYFMKTDDEDIFVLSGDEDSYIQKYPSSNETAQ